MAVEEEMGGVGFRFDSFISLLEDASGAGFLDEVYLLGGSLQSDVTLDTWFGTCEQ
jgi:hypothetical protein